MTTQVLEYVEPSLKNETQKKSTVADHLEPWLLLEGKVVFVTGASAGLGREFCLDLARAGCRVVAAARRADRLKSLCDEINAMASSNSHFVRAIAIELDVTADGPTIEASVKKVWDAFGHIDALINNAGVRDGKEPLETQAEVGDDGKLHVTVRKSTSSRSEIFSRRSHGGPNSGVSLTPRPSNLTNAEIYSLQSSRNPTPRGSSFNHTDFYSMVNGKNANMSPRHSNYGNFGVDEESGVAGFGRGNGVNGQGNAGYPAPTNAGIFSPVTGPAATKKKANGGTEGGKDLHMFVWSSSASPVSEGGIHVFRGGGEYGNELGVGVHPKDYDEFGREEFTFGNKQNLNGNDRAGPVVRSSSTTELRPKIAQEETKATAMPPASVMTRLILIMVWRKLIRNPNTYSSLIGLTWSLVSFKWNVQMPAIIAKSISILSDAGLGMAMFSLGLFMALSPRIIACGKTIAIFSMGVRFLTGPAVMAAASIAVGLRGVLLHIAIVQAALPQGIVPFVFAKEYGVHPDILSTGVIFGMLVALPLTLVYYILLGL